MIRLAAFDLDGTLFGGERFFAGFDVGFETFGDFAFTMRCRMETQRVYGAALSPMSALAFSTAPWVRAWRSFRTSSRRPCTITR